MWKWNASTITQVVIALLILVGAVVGLVYGITTHTEAGFDPDLPSWTPDEIPLAVCPHGSVGRAMGPLEHAVSVTNARLGFRALALADEGCEVLVMFGVPAGGTVRPGGGAVWSPAERRCRIEIVNVSGGAGDLETLTIQHELGHCLGLDHDDFEISIMRPVQRETPLRTLPPWITDHDRALLRARYMR